MDLTSIGKKLTDATTALAKADKDLKLEMAGAAADAAGIIDPSPASDIVGAGISIARGDYWGAALSTASMVPYVGDLLAKPAKAVRATKAIAGLEKKVAALTKTVTDLKKAKKEAEAIAAGVKERKVVKGPNVARDSAAKQGKAAAKKEKDCEDCGSTGDNKTKSIASVNGAGSRYGGSPAEHQSRYDKYLSAPSVKKLTPDAWYESAKRVWKNNADGKAFEISARTALKAPLGPGSKPISIEGYIPDLPIGKNTVLQMLKMLQN